MHELSVTESILNITLRHAQAAGAKRVTDLHLVIGRLATIVDDSVQFYWDIISKGTPAEGSLLHFERIPGEMTCQSCGHTFRPTGETFDCPACASPRVRISKGEEFQVDSIDVE
jgi:hydrogenase nickel incorporation protein HypA/HybF